MIVLYLGSRLSDNFISMATISKSEILEALQELGQLATAQGISIELILIGGAAMVLLFDSREATRDVDVMIVVPRNASLIRNLAKSVATKRGWTEDWLNDAAKGYLVGISEGLTVLSAPGILVKSPSLPQLLAMKLSAWRDDVDIDDASRLLKELGSSRQAVWTALAPFIVPGNELKATYAFSDLWESVHHDDI